MCSKTLAWYRSLQCHLESIQCGTSDHTFRECIPSNNCLGEERTFKIVSSALVCCEGMHIRNTMNVVYVSSHVDILSYDLK